MTTLLDTIHDLTDRVLTGRLELDVALRDLQTWLNEHAARLSTDDRDTFSAALDSQSTNDSHSLVDSVLKLHTTRLLYRFDVMQHDTAQKIATPENAYEAARSRFTRAVHRSEEGVNDARIDIAIANAHHLLNDPAGNRRWLDAALSTLPNLANTDLIALAEAVPPMPTPRLSGWKRVGLNLLGFPFERLAQSNRENLRAIAGMQMNQIIVLAHLLGTSYEAIRERQRARRAFRIAAHLIVRYQGMPNQTPDQLLEMAEEMNRFEEEAAQVLARQALALSVDHAEYAALIERAEQILTS